MQVYNNKSLMNFDADLMQIWLKLFLQKLFSKHKKYISIYQKVIQVF